METILEFNLLGGAEIRLNGRVLTSIRLQKARGLLYYLATIGQTHSRIALAGLLWGDLPEANARRNLRKALTRLRRVTGDRLVITRQTVVLRPDEYRIDVAQFLKMTAPGTGVDDWQLAVALYQGDFLAGFYVGNAPEFENWLLGRRAFLLDRMVSCLQQMANDLAHKREDVKAISYAKRLLELEPWREDTHRLLMTLYARSGQVASAIIQYELCRQSLAAELGLEPDSETQQLFASIRDRYMGASISGMGAASNLPLPATALIGREAELEELRTYLQNPTVRLLTIVGMGGAGKTRLALALASQLTDFDFPDGRFFSSFAELHFSDAADEETIQSTIAVHILSSMGATISAQEDPFRQLCRRVRQRRLLLILDNFESLLLAEVAPAIIKLVQAILAQAVQVKLLLTSRQPLHLRTEWIYDLDGLPVPHTDEDEADRTASVRLFNETAHRLSRFFDSAVERTAVYKICRLLDGLPLGIELAAGLIREKGCSEIAFQIERTLEGVAGQWQDLPLRQRSLKATFEYTWQLLTQPERQLLSMLAYMRRDFSVEAADFMAGNLSQFLDHLVAKSLIKTQADRFYLHEVVLEFAQQKLDRVPEWLRLAAKQHARFFMMQLERIEGSMETGDDYPLSQTLRPDLENIRTAWRWAIEQSEFDLLHEAARGLRSFFHNMGWLSEGMLLLEEAVLAGKTQLNHSLPTLINCLQQQALLAALGANMAKAAELANQSANYLATVTKQKSGSDILSLQAQQQFLQGYVAHVNSDWAAARKQLAKAALSFHHLNRTYDEARAYFVIGNGWMGERRWEKVIETNECVIELCQQTGNLRLEAKVLATMAVAYSSDNHLEKARQCREQAQKLSSCIVWPIRDEVVWFGMSADQALDAGYLDEAAAHIEQTMPLILQSGSRFYEDWHYIQNGHLLFQLGDYEKAMNLYGRARVCAVAGENPPMIAFAEICLCVLNYRWGQAEWLVQSAKALAAVTAQLDEEYYGVRAASWTGFALLVTNRAEAAKSNFLWAIEVTADTVCKCEALWGLMLCHHRYGEQLAAYDTAVALTKSPLFANLPLMVTELLLPFQIYYDCWQALLPVDDQQAEQVRQLASSHLQDRLRRIKNREWQEAYLQQMTVQGKFPIKSS
jgi:DNA-binding SARP family transcriptional activator/predicted ATPase